MVQFVDCWIDYMEPAFVGGARGGRFVVAWQPLVFRVVRSVARDGFRYCHADTDECSLCIVPHSVCFRKAVGGGEMVLCSTAVGNNSHMGEHATSEQSALQLRLKGKREIQRSQGSTMTGHRSWGHRGLAGPKPAPCFETVFLSFPMFCACCTLCPQHTARCTPHAAYCAHCARCAVN